MDTQDNVILSIIRSIISKFNSIKLFGWLCTVLTLKVKTIFTTRTAFQSSPNDVLPLLQQSKMVYKFQCQCDVGYISRTIQSPEVGVKQHTPCELLRWPQNTTSGSSQVHESAIDDYWADHYISMTNYLDDCFSVLYEARSKHCFFLKAIAITLYWPKLCKQGRQFDIVGGIMGIWIFCLF